MRKSFVLSVLFGAGVLCSTFVYAQGEYYVQSVKAKVMSDRSFKSKVLGEVGKGFKFVSGEKAGAWVKVSFDNRQGYVHSFMVAAHPPIDKVTIIKADDVEINKGVRRRASTYTSAAAARGLAQDDRKRLSRDEKADYYSLEQVESYRLDTGELNRFVEGTK